MTTHLAAVLPGQGLPLEVQSRPTPKPGPGELLIAVKSIALNPADALMRNLGLFIPAYPTVLGFDLAGIVLEVGEGVPTPASTNNKDSGPVFQPGTTRVAAYASHVWRGCAPDYGAFQERVLVPWQFAVPLPSSSSTSSDGGKPELSWNQAATLPVSVQVPLSAWDAMQIPRLEALEASPHSAEKKNEVLLIWGASSSVGSMGVQTAALLRDAPASAFGAVYATASNANHAYIKEKMGADRVFDYKDPDVVEQIVAAAREDGMVVRHCYLAMGDIGLAQGVLKAFLGEKGDDGAASAKIASAPPVPEDAEKVDGVEIIWVQPSMTDEEVRLGQFRYWMGTWLKDKLEKGLIIPSPEPTVLGKGLEAVNEGLDMLLKGVSCTKLVVELE